MWTCLDSMNFSILPQLIRDNIKHVPIVVYIPGGMLDSTTDFNNRVKYFNVDYVIDNNIPPPYFTADNICNWLHKVVELDDLITTYKVYQRNELNCGPIPNGDLLNNSHNNHANYKYPDEVLPINSHDGSIGATKPIEITLKWRNITCVIRYDKDNNSWSCHLS